MYRIGRPLQPIFRNDLPAIDYEESAEERYEAALNILAFSRKVRAEPGQTGVSGSAALGGVSQDKSVTISKEQIETADDTELEAMQQQLKEMQERINAQLRMRVEQDKRQQGPTMMTRGKRIAASKASERTVDASREADEEVDHPIVAKKNGSRAKPSHLDHVLVGEAGRGTTESAVTEPVTPAIEVNQAYGDRHEDGSQLHVIDDNVAIPDAPVVPTETDMKNADEPAPPASSDKTVAEAEPGNDTILKPTMEKHVDQVVDAALTPPSDMPKDYGDDMTTSLPGAKPVSSGVETPETTVADQVTSPAEAETMEIDRFDLE